jgi:hypothetical protein
VPASHPTADPPSYPDTNPDMYQSDDYNADTMDYSYY